MLQKPIIEKKICILKCLESKLVKKNVYVIVFSKMLKLLFFSLMVRKYIIFFRNSKIYHVQ